MIGGEHFLNVSRFVEDSLGDFLETHLGDISFFASGRDALFSILSVLPIKVVNLPDLMCSSVYDACRVAEKSCIVYRIGENLLHAENNLSIKLDSITFIMHYFGVRNVELMAQAKDAGSIVISDVTHLLFDKVALLQVAKASDYLVASLRKTGPFPDGGFVSSLYHQPPPPTRGLREDFLALRVSALLSRGFSARDGYSDEENYHLLKRAEIALDSSVPAGFACSYISRRLAYTISIERNAAAIQRNISVLAAGLREDLSLRVVDTSISPYYPCFFESKVSRDYLREGLAARRLFFPVHWPQPDLHVSSPLGDQGLSIPCDARYNETDMYIVLEAIKACLPS